MSGYVFEHEGKAFTPDGKVELQTTVDEHNRDAEQKELDWLKTAPDKVLLYVKTDAPKETMFTGDFRVVWHSAKVTTWLGTVPNGLSPNALVGPRRYIGFGHHSYRRAISAFIYGVKYVGWYMESSGDYCRLKKAKRQ